MQDIFYIIFKVSLSKIYIYYIHCIYIYIYIKEKIEGFMCSLYICLKKRRWDNHKIHLFYCQQLFLPWHIYVWGWEYNDITQLEGVLLKHMWGHIYIKNKGSKVMMAMAYVASTCFCCWRRKGGGHPPFTSHRWTELVSLTEEDVQINIEILE